jgi:hypothetical protein
MFRKLIALALAAGGIAAILKRRSSGDDTYETRPASPQTAATETAEAPAERATTEAAASATADTAETEAIGAPPADGPSDIAEIRGDQPESVALSNPTGPDGDEAVIPDISDDDPLVREAEAAAASDAGSIGGDADTVTAEQPPPEMRPVVEGAGDAQETFESTEDQGR